eukprot:CAMPEP_0172381938 /NCGR_PEP_ID=MMETSP1060-20121228/71206_1 /TAXON_ID=37318 /ORGANISM="Pseudo-nitzschia pungens, Strain cf. cingulata" /LENGTH=276 /DNA_ID=CAMNT_0013109729 /DNA_START=106 /DNA_END=936 /DNA_ORIENTATION=-
MDSDSTMGTSSMPLTPLEFVTPPSSPDRRKRNFAAENEPPALKRKRTTSFDATAVYPLPPMSANFPLLHCENFCNCLPEDSSNGVYNSGALAPPLPKITLLPRQKKSRRSRIPPFPQELEFNLDQENTSELTLRRRSRISIPTRTIDKNGNTPNTIPTIPKRNVVRRPSSSRSTVNANATIPRRPSLNMTRSLSLQLNLSLLNIAAAATSGSSSSNMPKRKSLIHVPCPTSSQDGPSFTNDEAEGRTRRSRSPVATTLDYLATAIRFPDGAIGLSI